MTPRTPRSALAGILPAALAAVAFACVAVFGKASFGQGADVETFLAFRGLLGAAVMGLWLLAAPASVPLSRREKAIALGLGLLFAGNVYTLFQAFVRIPVPIGELVYFVYPLLTGVLGTMTGVDRLGARGATAALAAFVGLALMIGAHTGDLASAGLLLAAAAAGFRAAMLLVARGALPRADPRLASWYTSLSSTGVFAALCLATSTWSLPRGAWGWTAFMLASIATVVAVQAMYVSTARIGPFRTALVMNLEPVSAIVLSGIVLGESINATQMAGAALMIGALVWFQVRR